MKNRRAPLAMLLVATLLPIAVAAPANAPAAPGTDEAPYLVGFHAIPGEARSGTYADARVERIDEALRFAVVHTRNAQALEARLSHDPNVRHFRYDDPLAYRPAWTPNDPHYAAQAAGWDLIRAPRAWDTTRGSASVTVAVIDSGLDKTHPDIDATRALRGYDFAMRDRDPDDTCGHGTHVTGTIAATSGNGIGVAGAAQVTILPVKAFDGPWCAGSWSKVASSIRYAADQGARILSMSLSCGISCYDTATADALDYAWGKGALLVVAAGNEGPCDGCIGFPATHPRVIPVGCVDASGARCSFASAGPGMVLAPGASILSTTVGGGYGLMSGTSMSTPHVSGAAALALSVNPRLTHVELRRLIETTARDIGPAGPDAAYGHGILDMAALVEAAQGGDGPPPAAGVALTPASSTATTPAGAAATHPLRLENTGTAADTFQLAAGSLTKGWKATLETAMVTLGPGEARVVLLSVKAPRNAAPGSSADVAVTAVSAADATARATVATHTRVV